MPPTRPSFPCTSDPAEAKTWFADLIEREPASLSVIGSVADGLIRDPTRYENPRWWAAREGDTVVAAFMHTPPHPVHIALSTAVQARALAAQLATQGDVLPGVGGLRGPAEAFAEEWVTRTGARSTVVMAIGSFDLPVRPQVPFPVSGRFRRATEGDLALVDAWHQEFVDVIEGAGRIPPSLHLQVADGRVGLWEDEGSAVSMAYASPANGGVTRISGVWTPPELRGHGYASGVVAALSSERQDSGEQCMLYTDLANPTSNAIYEAMGYRRVGDGINISFSA
ncbi:MAG TPA: GNAT family N-acetyltransferase [Humibacillus sp.]|nr:GNAT family N-acetyltransferase [Humibacillus sp.]